MSGTDPTASRSPAIRLAFGALALVVAVVVWWFSASGDTEPDPAPQGSDSDATGEQQQRESETDPSPASEDEPEPAPSDGTVSGLPACDLEELPATVLPVIEDIYAGGPFEHPGHDDGRFGNYEGLLPDEPLGYYREYTVETPGLDHRGARRIVTGGEASTDPQIWYYTDDHYESFCELDPEF